MGPEWYFDAAEACEESHDPADYDGREWNELTPKEQEAAIEEHIWGYADSLRD